MKCKNIVKIRNEIIRRIDNSQECKRMITYLTNTPLLLKGKNKLGSVVNQPDLTESLYNKNIYPMSFSLEILSSDKTIVFVHMYDGDLKQAKGKNIIVIDICTPVSYYTLEGMGEDRPWNLANYVCTLVDNENLGAGIGNAIVSSYKEGRVSNQVDYDVLSLFVEVTTSNLKIEEGTSC